MARRKRWSYSAGERPHTVVVEEREVGGTLRVRAWDATRRGGKGNWVRRSLGHRDQEKAKAYALEQSAKLMKGVADLKDGKLTLGQVFTLYGRHRTPRKCESEQQADGRRADMWTRFLGASRDPNTISLERWEVFIDRRRSGEIDARANCVAENERRPVRDRCVGADLVWLNLVFSWAVKWRTPQGPYLMGENPVRGYEITRELNPRRPVATTDRYEAIRGVSDQIPMEIRWHGKRTKQRSYLSELLDLAYATGRRISAICQLRYEDLRLEKTAEQPCGAIRWPGDTDKEGMEWTSPLNPIARAAIDRVLAERPGIGATPMFACPKKADRSIRYELASDWLKRAETLARVEPHNGRLWHAYRAGWATSRKTVPIQDVAAAGGWKTNQIVQDLYQRADPSTILRAVMHTGELREAQ